MQRSVVPARVALDHCELGVRKGATLARVVNNGGEDVTDQIAVHADAPLQVTVDVGETQAHLTVSIPAECTESLVVATSYHPGRPPEDAIDGDINTFWHSEYSPPHPLPQSITLNLRQVEQISKLTYQPRFDGNLNGTIKTYNIYVSTDGQSFTKVTTGTWPADARLKTATFTPVEARYVRLEATSASGGSFCSAAEVAAS